MCEREGAKVREREGGREREREGERELLSISKLCKWIYILYIFL